MRQLKALIKMELGPALWIGIYFIGVNILGLGRFQSSINAIESDDTILYALYGFKDIMCSTIFFYVIGFALYVFFSFMKDKNHASSRFLKALPYTMKERMLVKIGVALGTYVVSYIVLIGGIFALRIRMLNIVRELKGASTIRELAEAMLSISQINKRLVCLLIVSIAIFLFFIWMQYVINPRFGSVMSSILILLAPWFILENILMLLSPYFIRGSIPEEIEHSIMGLLDILNNMVYIDTTKDIQGYLFLWGCMIILLITGLISSCKHNNKIEKSDLFISQPIFRKIYILGVTVCGGLLLTDLYIMFSIDSRQEIERVLLVMGCIISFIIVYKITHKGLEVKE